MTAKTIKTKYKIVDSFNGYEDSNLYDSKEHAERALTVAVDNFYANGNTGCDCRLTIVPGHFDWYFDPRHNKFIWG